MEIIVNRLKTQTLEAFADEHGLTMIVNERNPIDMGDRWHPAKRFFAQFTNVEIKNGPILTATYGNGATIEDSIESYMGEISGKALVCGAYTGSRKTIKAPSFTSVK